MTVEEWVNHMGKTTKKKCWQINKN
jgi:hypothetical protein